MVRRRDRLVTILKGSLKSILVIIFISFDALRVFKRAYHKR